MPTDTLVALLVTGLAVAAAILVARQVWLKHRAEAWAQVAGELGLIPKATPELSPEEARLETFQAGHNGRLLAGAEGSTWGGDVLLADHQYVTGFGRTRRVHRRTVCVLRDAKLDLPKVVMRPERAIIDRVGELLGAEDLDFAEDPDFSSAFVLAGENEAAVRTLFTPSVRMQLMHLNEGRLHLEGVGPLLVVHHGRLIPPTDAGGLLQQTLEVAGFLRG